MESSLFSDLESINARPKPFEFYTAAELWTEEHTSAQMLAFHLNENVDLSSRKAVSIDQSVDWLVKHLGIAAGSRVIDFGCGPGLYASRLAGRGAEVTGVDFSLRSIKYARNQAKDMGLDIEYVNRNYLEFTPDREYDVALMIFCDFCALSPAQRKTLLAKFHSVLKPGGRVVLDACSLTGFGRRSEGSSFGKNLMDGFWSPGPYYGFLNTVKYEAEKVVLEKYTIIEEAKRKTIYNWLQYFSVEGLTREFNQAGLAVDEVFADVTGKPYDAGADEFAVVASKALG
jgi:cyclopropane fatty-acyl-phospholipid synthase-like methyltransferase